MGWNKLAWKDFSSVCEQKGQLWKVDMLETYLEPFIEEFYPKGATF